MMACVSVQFRINSVRFGPERRTMAAIAIFDATSQGAETSRTLRAPIVPIVYAAQEPSWPFGELEGETLIDSCLAIRTNPQTPAKRNTTRARRSAPLGRIGPLRVTAPSKCQPPGPPVAIEPRLR